VTTGRTSGRKTKRRKTIKPLRRSATTATPQTSDKKKIALLTRKLNDALSQQTATSREVSEALERETATSEVAWRYQQFAKRPRAGVPDHTRERDAALRSFSCDFVAL